MTIQLQNVTVVMPDGLNVRVEGNKVFVTLAGLDKLNDPLAGCAAQGLADNLVAAQGGYLRNRGPIDPLTTAWGQQCANTVSK